jgi:hypothetical protein
MPLVAPLLASITITSCYGGDFGGGISFMSAGVVLVGADISDSHALTVSRARERGSKKRELKREAKQSQGPTQHHFLPPFPHPHSPAAAWAAAWAACLAS